MTISHSGYFLGYPVYVLADYDQT